MGCFYTEPYQVEPNLGRHFADLPQVSGVENSPKTLQTV